MAIEPADRLARSIIYNDAFANDAVSQDALLCFMGNRNPDGSFDESVYLTRLITPDRLHALGCDQAARKNIRVSEKRVKKGLDPAPESGVDRKYYCGFATAVASVLSSPENDNYTVELSLIPEQGEESHVSVVLKPKDGKKLVPNDRTEAGRLLALAFDETNPHLCDCDVADANHPVTKWGAGVLIAR